MENGWGVMGGIWRVFHGDIWNYDGTIWTQGGSDINDIQLSTNKQETQRIGHRILSY